MIKPTKLRIFVDGASRGNPGPSGIGIYMADGATTHNYGFYIGQTTNNVAEYAALTVALYLLSQERPSTPVTVYSDSELLVKQINGLYRVKSEHLKAWHRTIMQLKSTVPFTIEHVLRDKNKQADALANQGVDFRQELPSAVHTFLTQMSLSW